MKKIGFLFGAENEFCYDVIEYLNYHNKAQVEAEKMIIDSFNDDEDLVYDVVFDRISCKVPYYRSILKYQEKNNIRIINKTDSNQYDNHLLVNSLAKHNGIKVLKSSVIPTKEHPPHTDSGHFTNLAYPFNWQRIFDFVGFPCIIKPNKDSNSLNAKIVYNEKEFFTVYDFTGSELMVLQEYVNLNEILRCYAIGNKSAAVYYDQRKPIHLRNYKDNNQMPSKLKKKIESMSLKITKLMGLDFNALNFVIRDNDVFAIDYYNPTPEIIKEHTPVDLYNWLVESTAAMIMSILKPKKTN